LLSEKIGRYIGPYLNPSVVQQVLSGDFDAIILHSYQYPSDWLAWLAARGIHTPFIFYGEMYPRGHVGRFQQIIQYLINRPMIRSAAACLAIGSVARDVYLIEYHVPIERIFLAPYAVDNEFFVSETNRWGIKKQDIKLELGIPFELPVILCVAGMVNKKRQEDLVRAMANLNTPARLILVGDGPLLEQMQAVCQSWLPETILVGFVNQSQLPRYYAIADIFVLPSLWEEFGLVINEAMCAGLPIITTNTVAGARDLVIEGENGFTFPAGDIAALSVTIKILLENSELRRRFGQRSLEIIQSWNYDNTVLGILAALESVKEQKNRGH